MGLAQLNYKISNLGPNKYLDYSHVQILAILPTHTRQLTYPLSISQLPIKTDEKLFRAFHRTPGGRERKL